ncbi:Holliday junction resolvase RuvX [Altererythrobacter sp. MF3-039]|uniref:Holliday junction resolvase RuvX n=1 Tax=Altererythrobacter sp. MF3-039 TaxID=3252901 RepID=UPI00390C6912
MASKPAIVETPGEFRGLLPDGGALLAIDLGTKTIGIAFCDAGWRFASPGKTLQRGKFKKDRELLAGQIAERNIAALVLGLPRNMDGTEGARAQSARAYARNLSEAFGLPILLWDERWSSASADAAMIGQDMSRARRAEKIDSHAAAVILQGAIDGLAGGIL